MKTFRRLAPFAWLLLWPLLAWMIWTPISFGALRLATLLVLFAIWLGALALAWKKRPLRFALFAAAIPVSVVMLWPARDANTNRLRAAYTRSLVNYQNTPYVWGGENARGIDCSGLMRRAWVDALVVEGFKTANPSLWRAAFAIWWRDCSAREMSYGYGNQIRTVFEAPSLNGLDSSTIRPGDMAVTQNGVHVLAFLENKTWIQADPNLANGGDKVIQTQAPSKNGWFGLPVVIVRWKQLDE